MPREELLAGLHVAVIAPCSLSEQVTTPKLAAAVVAPEAASTVNGELGQLGVDGAAFVLVAIKFKEGKFTKH